MKNVLESIGRIVGALSLMLLVNILVVGTLSFGVEIFFIENLIDAGFVRSASEFRENAIAIGVVIMLPPLVLMLLNEIPRESREELIELALSVLKTMSWVGYGVLFAAGMYLFCFMTNS